MRYYLHKVLRTTSTSLHCRYQKRWLADCRAIALNSVRGPGKCKRVHDAVKSTQPYRRPIRLVNRLRDGASIAGLKESLRAPGWEGETGADMKKETHIEKRGTQRFELPLTAHFRLSKRGVPSRWGTGTVHDISSSGISLRSRRSLPEGCHLELLLDWPAAHDGQFPMHLHATGFVVRSSGSKAAMRITSHRFRIATEVAQPMGAIA